MHIPLLNAPEWPAHVTSLFKRDWPRLYMNSRGKPWHDYSFIEMVGTT